MSPVPEGEVLAVVYDHYKDSFTHIKEREKRRDRLFAILILIFAFLLLEVFRPAVAAGMGSSTEVAGLKIDLSRLPGAALLDLTWVATLLIGLQYCQASVAVERQYRYLHELEADIERRLGDGAVFSREGRSYLKEYPRLLDWAWLCYVILFPAIVTAATAFLVHSMWETLPYGRLHLGFSSLCAAALVISFGLYRVAAHIRWLTGWMTGRLGHKRQPS